MIRKISPVQISNKAKEEILSTYKTKNIPSGYALRAGVKDTGSENMSYILGFDTKTDNDDEFDIDGITLIIDKSHILHLAGLKIDYKDEEQAKGFIFLPKT